MGSSLNRRGKIAVWLGAAGAALTIIAWDWRPLVVGMIVMIALAATGATQPSPQPTDDSEDHRP